MTEYKRSRSGAKKAGKELKEGDEFFVVADVSRRAGAFEDRQLVKRYTVTGTHPLLGGAMVGGQSVEGIVLRDGPAYTERPVDIRGIWEPAPQVAGPLGDRPNRPLNAREIRQLEEEVANNLADRYGKARAKREAKTLVAKHLKKVA